MFWRLIQFDIAYITIHLEFASSKIVPTSLAVKLIKFGTPFVLRQNPIKIGAGKKFTRFETVWGYLIIIMIFIMTLIAIISCVWKSFTHGLKFINVLRGCRIWKFYAHLWLMMCSHIILWLIWQIQLFVKSLHILIVVSYIVRLLRWFIVKAAWLLSSCCFHGGLELNIFPIATTTAATRTFIQHFVILICEGRILMLIIREIPVPRERSELRRVIFLHCGWILPFRDDQCMLIVFTAPLRIIIWLWRWRWWWWWILMTTFFNTSF